MTDEDLEAIKARADGATPGPWCAWRNWVRDADGNSAAHGDGYLRSQAIGVSDWWDQAQAERNAAFIAHAREDVPALLRAVERLLPVVRAIAEDACVNSNWDACFWCEAAAGRPHAVTCTWVAARKALDLPAPEIVQ